MSTTVSTPWKKPGRLAPSSTSPSGPGLTRTSGSPSGYISSRAGAKTRSTPARPADLEVGFEGAGVAVEVLVRAELQRVDEDRREHAGRRARGRPRSSASCPSCSAPIVITTPTLPVQAGPRPAASSAAGPDRPSRHAAPRLRSGEHVEQRLGVQRAQPTGGDRAVGGAPGQREVRAAPTRATWRQSRSRCRATVPASPRDTGPVSAASPSRRALSSAARSSGASTFSGWTTPASRSRSSASLTSVTRWLAPCAERGVVERAVGLGDPLGLAAEVGHQPLGERA